MDRTVRIIYGKDIPKMTRELLSSYGVEKKIPSADAAIVLKPNLVAVSRPEEGAVTHTEIVIETIEYLQSHGFRNITIAEGSWVGASTKEVFALNGYPEIAKKYDVRLLDTKHDKFRTVTSCGMDMEISETILNADYLISMPVLKGHCQTKMTSAMKNLKGCLSDRSKRDFHKRGLMLPIAALNMVVKPDLNIIDSISGDLDFEEGGNPVETDRMILSDDSLAADIFSASLMGYRPEDIGYIKTAGTLGCDISSENIKVLELNKPTEARSSHPTGEALKLGRYTDADDACSACYASLIRALKRLDDEGCLRNVKEKIAIGQGWRGKAPHFGVGACCRGADEYVKGCPPSAADVTAALMEKFS